MTADDRTLLRDGSGAGPLPETTAPRILKERFVLEHNIGAGGMGTVFRAKDLRRVEARDRNPFVAVKVLNNEFRTHRDAFVALQREAAKAQALSHVNIVSIYDFDKDGDIPFMTMELLEGEELAEVLRRHPAGLPAEAAWRVISDMCHGLTHAHEAGFVHSDFKPGNVFVTNEGTSKILDFGIARAVQMNKLAGEESVFDPGSLAALTPAYASREMLTGEVPEPADDVYSLAVVIYLVLTGRHPYDRVRADEAYVEGLRPVRPKGLNRGQWQALRWALALDRASRPPSAGAFARRFLAPPVWRTGGFAAAALAVALVGAIPLWSGDSDDVRQRAVVEAQSDRIEDLLRQSVFDASWETELRDELTRLQALDGEGVLLGKARRDVSVAYVAAIARTLDASRSLPLLDGIRSHGDTGGIREAESLLRRRLIVAIETDLGAVQPTRAWFEGVETRFDQLARVVGRSQRLAQLNLDLADAYVVALDHAIGAGDLDLAAEMVAAFRAREFDAELIDAAHAQLEAARRVRDERLAAAHARERERSLEATLETTAADLSCFRPDVAQLNAAVERLGAAFPAAGDRIRDRLIGRYAGCLAVIGQSDSDRARSLRAEAMRTVGAHPSLAGLRFDPCAMEYLIGGGRAAGRGGFCTDRVADGPSGPRLVVIPETAGLDRYAITKFEVTFEQLDVYCRATGACATSGRGRLPATGIDAGTANEYAAWLSRTTGYRYRLPYRSEWDWAARGAAGERDPNRNCRVSLSGVERGLEAVASTSGMPNEFGVVNALGNVQEWVVDGDLLLAVGGAFPDPLDSCDFTLARAHDGGPDSITGFRLVRELR